MREESELRQTDEALSNEVSAFLDRTFYKENVAEFERVYDEDRQTRGLDTIFTISDKKYYCDEKASVRHRNLFTGAFEISFINRAGNIQDGWFVRDNLDTNSYLYIWLDDRDGHTTVEAALIRKEIVVNYVEGMGWTKEKLKKKAAQIRVHDGANIYMGNIYKNNCKFSFTKYNEKGEKFPEEPINLLLRRDMLISMADIVFKRELK